MNACINSLSGYPKSMRLANIGPLGGLAGVNYGCVSPRKIAGCSSGGSTSRLKVSQSLKYVFNLSTFICTAASPFNYSVIAL